ncbi:MAG: Glu/Leu/Phe/Val family dehydrogenase, partial [Candidatus Kapaibacteriota bacterium]
EKITGFKAPGFITGKPFNLGGSLGRTEATGYGVIYTVREALNFLGVNIKDTTASFQGFGNVSQYALELYTKMGGKAIAVSTWDPQEQKAITFRKKDGIKFEELISITNKFGEIDKAKAKDLGYELLPGSAWIEQEVDILIPAALENQINKDTVVLIKPSVKIIAEGANGPTTPEADGVIKERNIHVIPDFLCNAGGVTCSYFEQVQSNMNYYWTKDEVLSKLDQKMTSAYHAVLKLSNEKGVYMRDAAYMIAISRVVDAVKLRGWV